MADNFAEYCKLGLLELGKHFFIYFSFVKFVLINIFTGFNLYLTCGFFFSFSFQYSLFVIYIYCFNYNVPLGGFYLFVYPSPNFCFCLYGISVVLAYLNRYIIS